MFSKLLTPRLKFFGKLISKSLPPAALVLLPLLAIAGWEPQLAYGGVAPAKVSSLVKDGCFLVTKGGAVVAEHNPSRRLTTASIFKLATAAAALKILGPDFRFETDFYQGEDGELAIKGWGDPALTSEEASFIIDRLAEKELRPVPRLLLDTTAFHLDKEISAGSLNPYDAGNGPLAVNFNTINVVVGGDQRVRSGEPQTPTLPLMASLGRSLPVGAQRIAIPAREGMASRYAGELFLYLGAKQAPALFRPEKIAVTNGGVAAAQTPLYRHRSRTTLSANLAELLRYSNNFIANQIFLTLGAKRYGYPATWAKGKAALENYLYGDLGIPQAELVLEEGSGLSRANQATAKAMLTILEAFRPHAELLPSRQGRLVKSGTLSGVYAYAGYFNKQGKRDPFVLILNQPRNTRDQLLDLLEECYLQAQ